MAICKACGQAIKTAKVGVLGGYEAKNTKGVRGKVTKSLVNKASKKSKAYAVGAKVGKGPLSKSAAKASLSSASRSKAKAAGRGVYKKK